MTTITFDTETCSRCGGCGEYSYCSMYGKMCFNCKGKGKQYTKAALKAIKAITEFKTRYARRADELVSGDIVKYEGRYRTVKTAELNGLTNRSRVNNGEWTETPQFLIQFQGVGLITAPGAMLEVRYTADQFRNELLPFAKTLKGVTIEGE